MKEKFKANCKLKDGSITSYLRKKYFYCTVKIHTLTIVNDNI